MTPPGGQPAVGSSRALPLRVLVIDDSPINRHVITEALVGSGEIIVVGHAANGEQALRMVAELEPDALALDVQMPKMDGFTFLRILMVARPVPVVVLSSFSSNEVIFRALELGASDFVAKPSDLLAGSNAWRKELVAKLLALRPVVEARRSLTPGGGRGLDAVTGEVSPGFASASDRVPTPAKFVVAIAASTGGPSALLHILSRMPATYPGGIVIAQHMASAFTRTFAERLNRTTPLVVTEARDGDVICAGHAYIARGGSSVVLKKESGLFRVSVVPPNPGDRYAPSGNRLFTSAAAVLGARAVAVVLTGMADDGVTGAKDIRAAGGVVIAESEFSAVMNGMPGAVVDANLASKVLPLSAIAGELALLK